MRHELANNLRGCPGLLVKADAGITVALPKALDHDHQIGPDRLRTGIAAPATASDRGDEKQCERRKHEQASHEVEFLRPDLQKEKEETIMRNVEQHRLVWQVWAAEPAQPRQPVIDAERDRHHQPLQRTKRAMRKLD